jgi:hypothetical protein
VGERPQRRDTSRCARIRADTRGGDGRFRQELAGRTMNDEQFRAIRGLLVTIVILLGLIAGILLALAWEYL